MSYYKGILRLLCLVLRYRLARHGILAKCRPITLTFSVTGMCQSSCKTCHIGREFKKNPERIRELDLRLHEIEDTFRNLGHVHFLNISGGEPYLRDDMPEIVELGMKYLRPSIVHIPTNAFLPDRIERVTRRILKIITRYDDSVHLTVKPSVDGIGQKHDEIRGLRGSFDRLKETIARLKVIEEEYKHFHLELGTVISIFNYYDMEEIEDWVHKQGVQSYRNEVAELREEFFNTDDEITPSYDLYEKTMKRFKQKVQSNLRDKKPLTKLTESMRLVYYDLAVKIMRERRQVIPCYAGISNVHMNYDGDIWPCCVLGYAHSMGNVRDFEYSIDALYNSERAKDTRAYIRAGSCYCPLANQAYANMLMNPSFLLRVAGEYLAHA